MDKLADFFWSLDALKLIERRSYVGAGVRKENSAEHSWHLAMACWAFAETFDRKVSMEKLLKLALIHDLGETHAGDTFLYDAARSSAHTQERKGVEVFAAHQGHNISDMLALWDEQEYGNSEETRLIKVVDRLLPLILNLHSEGLPWREHKVTRSQVYRMHHFIRDLEPEIFVWIEAQIQRAVNQGWLIDD